MSNQKAEQQKKLVEVTLAKPHTHGDKEYAAGAKIMVTEPERAWLIEHQIVAAPAKS